MTENKGLLVELKEVVLEIRQYLCNTEFAPEPFTEPVDIEKLTMEFPALILSKFQAQLAKDKAKIISVVKGAGLSDEIQTILDDWRPFTTTSMPMIKEILYAQLQAILKTIDKEVKDVS